MACSGSSSRKNSTESRSSRRMAKSAPASRRRRKGRPIRGNTIRPAALSLIVTPGCGSGGSGRFKATAASSRSCREPSISTTSHWDADTIPATRRVAPNPMYSSRLTRSSPTNAAARRRATLCRVRHRDRYPGTRPHCPRPHIVTAWRTAVPPPAVPCVQRITEHIRTLPLRSPSPTWRAATSGSRGTPSRRATTLPDPIRRPASRTDSGGGGASGQASMTPSTTARNVPPPPAAMTSAGWREDETKAAAAERTLGWSSSTCVLTSSSSPYPSRSSSAR